MVVASARFYQVVLEYLLPFIGQLLENPIARASMAASGQILATTNPATLSSLTMTQIGALATPFGFQTIDLRPILSGQWSGAAPLEAGLIYYVIFAFHVTLFVRRPLSRKTSHALTSSATVVLQPRSDAAASGQGQALRQAQPLYLAPDHLCDGGILLPKPVV